METQKQIDQFWKKTEKLLKGAKPRISGIYRQISNEIDILIKGYEINAEKLKKPLTYKDKKSLQETIKSWKEQGIYTGQFKMYVEYNKKSTYDDLLLIWILYYFYIKHISINKLCRQLAQYTAEDVKRQAESEYKGRLSKVTDQSIDDAMFVMRDNMSFDEYLIFLLLSDAQETMVNLRAWMQTKVRVTKERLAQLLDKLSRKLISIRKGKYSGALVQTLRTVANKIYVWLFRNEKGKCMLFIADIDERTTPMCRSLHLQRFSPRERNVFMRYSAEAEKEIRYDVVGMVSGVNLPPISDHFHWCRSRIIYSREEE